MRAPWCVSAALFLLLGTNRVQAQEPKTAADWWAGLPAGERVELRSRYDRFRGLNAEAQREVRRRTELLAAERRAALAAMDPAQRAAWEALAPSERRRRLDEQVRTKLLARAREVGRQYPAAFSRLRRMPLAERMEASVRMLEGSRGEDTRAALQRALEEGWLGQRALQAILQSSSAERLSALGVVNKLRFLEQARKEGLWERYQLDEFEHARLVQMSPIEFFRAVGMLQRGVPKHRVLELPALWLPGPAADQKAAGSAEKNTGG